jgi:hypothetical protein
MTDYQKNKIMQFRRQGMGYKAIANILGLSRDIVRGFCKRCGLDGTAAVIQKNIELKTDDGFLCAFCSKPLKQPRHGRKRRFCSDDCRRNWWKENADKASPKETALYAITCAFCKKEFSSYGNKNRKYCNHTCFISDRFGGSSK